MRLFRLFILAATLLFGETTVKIATYNVQNLFDLDRSGYEYEEYIPYTRSGWNDKMYNIKRNHLAKVIKDIDADIIALQEVESLQALKDLRYTLKRKGLYYPYYKIANAKKTTVKVAILSKIPFVYAKELFVTHSNEYRNILELKVIIENKPLYIFVNHWKSKSGPESRRIVSAKVLHKRIKQLGLHNNIIALGDFNSDYEEYIRFARKRRHNDTKGVTGINHILGTVNYQINSSKAKVQNFDFYNLWYDVNDTEKRYTYIYRGRKEALDHILVSAALLDKRGLEYKENTIHSLEKKYLFRKKNIYRWQLTWKKPRRHLGKGYSDHLPLIAEFTVIDTN